MMIVVALTFYFIGLVTGALVYSIVTYNRRR